MVHVLPVYVLKPLIKERERSVSETQEFLRNEEEWWPLGSYSNEGVPGIISPSDFQLTANYYLQLALYVMVNKRGILTLDKESPVVLFHAPNHLDSTARTVPPLHPKSLTLRFWNKSCNSLIQPGHTADNIHILMFHFNAMLHKKTVI